MVDLRSKTTHYGTIKESANLSYLLQALKMNLTIWKTLNWVRLTCLKSRLETKLDSVNYQKLQL